MSIDDEHVEINLATISTDSGIAHFHVGDLIFVDIRVPVNHC